MVGEGAPEIFFIKAMRTLAKIVKINFSRILEFNQDIQQFEDQFTQEMATYQQKHHVFVVFYLALSSFPSPQLHSNLGNQQHHNYLFCENEQLSSHRKGQNAFGLSKKPYAQRSIIV